MFFTFLKMTLRQTGMALAAIFSVMLLAIYQGNWSIAGCLAICIPVILLSEIWELFVMYKEIRSKIPKYICTHRMVYDGELGIQTDNLWGYLALYNNKLRYDVFQYALRAEIRTGVVTCSNSSFSILVLPEKHTQQGLRLVTD